MDSIHVRHPHHCVERSGYTVGKAGRGSPLTAAIEAIYTDCPACSHGHQHPQAASIIWESLLNRLLRDFHEGKIDPDASNAELTGKIAAELKRSAGEGWPDFNSPDWDTPDFGTIARLRENIFVFSGAKTVQELKEISSMLLTDDGRVKSFSKFKGDVLSVWEKYNVAWLNSERDHAVASSQMAARWSEFEKNKDINPNITFRTVGDERVRNQHALLDGMTKPKDDPIWNTYWPPLDWGCRCDGDESDNPVSKKSYALPELKPMFRGNVYKDGAIFPDTHPYFDQLSPEAVKAGKRIKDTLMAEDYLKNAYKGKRGGRVDLHWLHRTEEIQGNMATAKKLADAGERVKLLPYSNQPGIKNPDASIGGKIADFKSPEPKSKHGVSNAIRHAHAQGAKVVVFDFSDTPDWMEVCRQLKGRFNPEVNREVIEQVWVIRDGETIKLKADEIWEGLHYQKLL